ncbi:glutamine--fructose-6-phosphate transaminase (isomerizing) [Solimonas sp. K1W22B-7]|uniref:glutamine--fructose-6-phosphate transaminase (isomerizing) n=1 Tax=Solimonas sp. K1W22B-7 TaxID=2303331 RepID=UPI000E33404D|nr:glutamine--fructose-6-phosphate transaminase (isomerizing) [Solimonas sp. K1W22B-7]AXQ27354.1 glutamine--fructose-6-phosphate transaminase (isomerizing) [Solimonas sp. K1W22B-7]
MCGLVGAVADRNVVPVLMDALQRLEYRGYDSAGVALLDGGDSVSVQRCVGRVADLARSLRGVSFDGGLGIGHTRWATHGEPAERNAHPHVSRGEVAVVHNGIIENFRELRRELQAAGYEFLSDTDTEVIAHLLHRHMCGGRSLAAALRAASAELRGAYAVAVVAVSEPETLVVTRRGSPLVIGVGDDGHYVASDVTALLPVTARFVFLEEGDIAELSRGEIRIRDIDGETVERPQRQLALSSEDVDKGAYRHYMHKEIHEQPRALADSLQGRSAGESVLEDSLGFRARGLVERIRAVHLVACGTSHHAGLVARYWLEAMTGLPCSVELASEFRYRLPAVPRNCLFVGLSQSGETADTLAALRYAKESGYLSTLAICNVAESSLVREAGLSLLTRAGPELGVASTKAFTTQLSALLLLTALLSRRNGPIASAEAPILRHLAQAPVAVEAVLRLEPQIEKLARQIARHNHALFIGRGPMYPIAQEGALKLKEISYIHAEAYAAGELKHGPLALVDEHMPVIALAPASGCLDKLESNLQEVAARGGRIYAFADRACAMEDGPGMQVICMPEVNELLAPMSYTVALQLLAYHVALVRGTDVDRPRNLAKSVTVE